MIWSTHKSHRSLRLRWKGLFSRHLLTSPVKPAQSHWCFEVLETRELLSGTDDGLPTSGDSGSGDVAEFHDPSGQQSLPESFYGLSDLSNGIAIPGHWQQVLPGGYSWGSADIFSYQPRAEETTVYSSVTTDAMDADDADDKSVVISNYSFTISVAWEGSTYTESITGQLTRWVIATTDESIRDQAQADDFDFSSHGHIRLDSDLNYKFSQTYSGDELSKVDISIKETRDLEFQWQAAGYTHFSASPDASVDSDATFSVTGRSFDDNEATFSATITTSEINYESDGKGRSGSGTRQSPNGSESLVATWSGTTTSLIGNVDDPTVEGKRISYSRNGTVSRAFSSSYDYSGNGKITFEDGNRQHSSTFESHRNSDSKFENNLTVIIDAKEVGIDVVFLGTEEADQLGLTDLTSGSGFLVNVAADDSIDTRSTTTAYSKVTDKSHGSSDEDAHLTISFKDGIETRQPGEGEGGGWKIEDEIHVDIEAESTQQIEVVKNFGDGYEKDIIDATSNSKVTGLTKSTTVQKLTIQQPVGEIAEATVSGTITRTGNSDLTTNATSHQKITHQSEQSLVLLGTTIELGPAQTGGDDAATDGDEDGASDNLQGSGDSTGDDGLPTPDDATSVAFNDYLKSVLTIHLITVSKANSEIDIEEVHDGDEITITDNSTASQSTEYQDGSYIESSKDRKHTPSQEDQEVFRQGVNNESHEERKKTISGTTSSETKNVELKSILTLVQSDDATQTSDTDDGTVTAEASGMLGESDRQYKVTTTGTIVESSTIQLSNTIEASGDSSINHWRYEGETHISEQTKGSWSETGNSSSRSSQTTTTVFLANKSLTIDYVGSSQESLHTVRTITSDASRTQTSGELPEPLENSHGIQTLSESQKIWIDHEWVVDPTTIDTSFAAQTTDIADIENLRDRFDQTFEFVKANEHAKNTITTDTFSGSTYNFKVTLTPKETSEDSGDGGEALSEPTAETGGDATAEIDNYRDKYDVTMTGNLAELDVSSIQNVTNDRSVEMTRMSQLSGFHPESQEYTAGQFANNVLPEWLNRYRLRNYETDLEKVISESVETLNIDGRSTVFTGESVTTTTLGLPPQPAGGDSSGSGGMDGGSGTGSGQSDDGTPTHPFDTFADSLTPFYERRAALLADLSQVSNNINGKLAGDNGTSGPAGGSGSGGSSDGDSSNSGTLYLAVKQNRQLDHRHHSQEMLFMDDLRAGQGYFSIYEYALAPFQTVSQTENRLQGTFRDLVISKSLSDYLDEREMDVPTDDTSSQPTASDGSSSATADQSDDANYQDYVPSGELTGTLKVVQHAVESSDYRWDQMKKVHSVTLEGVRVRAYQEKHATRSHNSEETLSISEATFNSDGSTKVHRVEGLLKEMNWMVSSSGESEVLGVTVIRKHDLTSHNDGDYWMADRWEYTHQSGDTNTTRSGSKAAFADASGQIIELIDEIYIVDLNLDKNSDRMIRKITERTVDETVSGQPTYTYQNGSPQMDVGSNQIVFVHNEEGSATLFFLLTSEAVNPLDIGFDKQWGSLMIITELETYAYGEIGENIEYHAIATTLGTRFMGLLTLAGGVIEVAVGVSISGSVIGAAFGVVAVVHGIDTIFAGAGQLLSGGERRTLTAQAATSTFLSFFPAANNTEMTSAKGFGDAVDMMVGLADMGYGAIKAISKLSKAARAADTATGVRAIAGAADNLDEASRMRAAARGTCNAAGECFVAGVPVAVYLSPSKSLLLAKRQPIVVPESGTQASAIWLLRCFAFGGMIYTVLEMTRSYSGKDQPAPANPIRNRSRLRTLEFGGSEDPDWDFPTFETTSNLVMA